MPGLFVPHGSPARLYDRHSYATPAVTSNHCPHIETPHKKHKNWWFSTKTPRFSIVFFTPKNLCHWNRLNSRARCKEHQILWKAIMQTLWNALPFGDDKGNSATSGYPVILSYTRHIGILMNIKFMNALVCNLTSYAALPSVLNRSKFAFITWNTAFKAGLSCSKRQWQSLKTAQTKMYNRWCWEKQLQRSSSTSA